MDEEDYGFEYSDDDQEEEDVNIENTYYNAKGCLDDEPDEALKSFREVVSMESRASGVRGKHRPKPSPLSLTPHPQVSMESEQGEWGFKAHKQIVKLHFKRAQYEVGGPPRASASPSHGAGAGAGPDANHAPSPSPSSSPHAPAPTPRLDLPLRR